MQHCVNCGEKNTEEAKFCVHCGFNFEEKKPIETIETNEPALAASSVSTEQVVREPRKMSRKQKALYSTVGALALLAIIAHLIMSSLFDPMKKIQAMNEAYNQQDKEALFTEFNIPKGTVGDADVFYSLVKEYGWVSLRDSLTYEVGKLKNKQPTDIIYNRGELIVVEQKPILLGLYNKVNFTLIPTEVSVYAPFKDMVITLGGHEVTSEEDEKEIVVGKFIPGEYEWSYEYEGKLMPLVGAGTTNVYAQEDNHALVEFDWNFQTLYVDANIADAVVYIDGKSTKKTVEELEEIYPAQIRSNIDIYAEVEDADGNIQKSDVLQMDDEYLQLTFAHVEKEDELKMHEEEVRRLFKDFRADYEHAIDYTNIDYIDGYFKDGSKIKRDYAKFIIDHRGIPGYRYDFQLNDIKSFKVVSDTKFEVYSFETFDFSSDEEPTTHYEREKKYVISHEKDAYYIEEITNLDTKKTKR